MDPCLNADVNMNYETINSLEKILTVVFFPSVQTVALFLFQQANIE